MRPPSRGRRSARHIDFNRVNRAALEALPYLLGRWLPDGRALGQEWTARNPTRVDRRPGSFRINLRSGRWADFATGDTGGDPVSLAAYLFNLSQAEAASRLVGMLGIGDGQ
ncbi:hypothetical protein [Microvirga massiliensis]|uniref:hypothetical protein n=1 Tax=Microvirga massiliensis TaxID=1033741 RepID=UPI00062BC565|nr:hypothetical protein [Microvirga massiliensis]